MEITLPNINFFLAIIAVFSVVFSIYKSYRNPQIQTDQTTIKLRDDITQLQKDLVDMRETHLKGLENDLKGLTQSVNALSNTVIKLSTIIDERIPKGSPNLTPPGL